TADVIRKVDASGTITTVVGTGKGGSKGDGGPATAAEINNPARIHVDTAGNLDIADSKNNRVRQVESVGAATAPGVPTGVSAGAGDAQATVSWTAPAADGGSPITSYTVTSSGGQTATVTTTSATVTGLTNGTTYTFTVVATNAVGTGPA